MEAADALEFFFKHVPDKEQSLKDLNKLTSPEDNDVRIGTARSLGTTYQHFSEKQQAWDDLHRLTSDDDYEIRVRVALALGYIFQYVPDSQKALEDLYRLSLDAYRNVRIWANQSIGKICIYKASQSENEEEYEKELEKAINFFERASIECHSVMENPSPFCLPFYRSFYTIISAEKKQAKGEVEKYLLEAKSAIGGSKNKKLLFDTVENLANALEEIQNLENMDLATKKRELNFYRKYCDQAEELIKNTEKTAPSATQVLRKGLPILDRKLKSLLEEIQEKAKTACRESQGTDTEEIACAVSREVQKWEIGSQEEMTQKVEDAAYLLKSKVADLPENEYILNKIEVMRHEKDLTKQYETLLFVIGQIPTVKVVPEDVVVENINKVGQDLGTKLDGLTQEMSEIRISLKPGIKEEIEISSGIDVLGTGAKHIVTIPLQEISYDELKDDLKRIKGKHITKLSRLPDRLARKIKGYLLLNDREDLVEQLS